VDDDRLPAEIEPLVSEDLRERGIKILQGLLASDKVDLDRFQTALDGLLKARTHADFAEVLRSLTEAEFDDWDVRIVVNVGMGSGFPVVRLSASCTMGTIRLMHPKEKRQRRWGRRRR
jgi:hypothetical protein